jgi:hypothetical protein
MRELRTISSTSPREIPDLAIAGFTKRIFVVCLAAQLFCLGANAAALPRPRASDDKKDSDKDNKVEVRNNAASLLHDLLGDEKNVSKILIIKHNSPQLGKVIKDVSKTAGDGSDKLEEMAKSDKTLNLHALQLPPGEIATREAVSKTKEHELLLTSGTTFELNLLLTQTEALSYGSHLAKIAAENSASPEEQHEFHALDVALDNLYKQVVEQIRALPRK